MFLVVMEAPYSERFVSIHYLIGYVVFTRVPMVLILLHFSRECGSYLLLD